jgi:glycosyltransferase involved in cell wall biosynthesis
MRVGVVSDYREERWPSMDLVFEMLFRELEARGDGICARGIRPPFVRRFTRIRTGAKHLFNADRLLNRFVDYPRYLRKLRSEFDLFHIVDHTYAHLVPVVGGERCVVTCHDIDAFRPVIQTQRDGYSGFMRRAAARILGGLRQAAAVACASAATRDELLRHRLAAAQRLSVNPNGVAEAFRPCPHDGSDEQASRLLGPPDRGAVEILHVGSTIPRKRIDVLVRAFAPVRRELPSVRLVRVGGGFTAAQRELIRQLGLPDESINVLPYLAPEVLAAVYRRAAIVLMPSEYEGFGLPALEAQACATPVLLSSIAALREIGGPAAAFCPVGDTARWSAAVLDLLRERRELPHRWSERRMAGLKWAGRFTWRAYAGRAVQLYHSIAQGL